MDTPKDTENTEPRKANPVEVLIDMIMDRKLPDRWQWRAEEAQEFLDKMRMGAIERKYRSSWDKWTDECYLGYGLPLAGPNNIPPHLKEFFDGFEKCCHDGDYILPAGFHAMKLWALGNNLPPKSQEDKLEELEFDELTEQCGVNTSNTFNTPPKEKSELNAEIWRCKSPGEPVKIFPAPGKTQTPDPKFTPKPPGELDPETWKCNETEPNKELAKRVEELEEKLDLFRLTTTHELGHILLKVMHEDDIEGVVNELRAKLHNIVGDKTD